MKVSQTFFLSVIGAISSLTHKEYVPQLQVAHSTHSRHSLFAIMSTVQTKDMNFQTNQLNVICESLFDVEQNIKDLTNLRSQIRENAVELLLMVESQNLPHRHNRLVLSLVATDTWKYRDATVTQAQRKVDKLEKQLKVAKAELKAAQSVAQKNNKASVVDTTYSCRMSGAR